MPGSGNCGLCVPLNNNYADLDVYFVGEKSSRAQPPLLLAYVPLTAIVKDLKLRIYEQALDAHMYFPLESQTLLSPENEVMQDDKTLQDYGYAPGRGTLTCMVACDACSGMSSCATLPGFCGGNPPARCKDIFQVFVRDAAPPHAIQTYDAGGEETVEALKAKMGRPDVDLYFGYNMRLEEGRTLCDYGIGKDSFITAVRFKDACAEINSCDACAGADVTSSGCVWCAASGTCENAARSTCEQRTSRLGCCQPGGKCAESMTWPWCDPKDTAPECSDAVSQDPSKTCCLSTPTPSKTVSNCPAGWVSHPDQDEWCTTDWNLVQENYYRHKCTRQCP